MILSVACVLGTAGAALLVVALLAIRARAAGLGPVLPRTSARALLVRRTPPAPPRRPVRGLVEII